MDIITWRWHSRLPLKLYCFPWDPKASSRCNDVTSWFALEMMLCCHNYISVSHPISPHLRLPVSSHSWVHHGKKRHQALALSLLQGFISINLNEGTSGSKIALGLLMPSETVFEAAATASCKGSSAQEMVVHILKICSQWHLEKHWNDRRL